MKQYTSTVFLALAGAALVASPAVARTTKQEASMLVTGSIVVAPSGSVHSYVLDKADQLPPATVGLIAKSIADWKFEPVRVDGKPALAKAKMSLRLVAKQVADDKYAISIRNTWFGKGPTDKAVRSRHRQKPHYPRALIHQRVQGTVYLLVRINRSGQVTNVGARQVNLRVRGTARSMKRWRHMLADASVHAAKNWTFTVPTSGKNAGRDHWVVQVPVTFRVRRSRPPFADRYGKWRAYIPGPPQLLPWQENHKLATASVDAVPPGGVYSADSTLHLLTPLGGG